MAEFDHQPAVSIENLAKSIKSLEEFFLTLQSFIHYYRRYTTSPDQHVSTVLTGLEGYIKSKSLEVTSSPPSSATDDNAVTHNTDETAEAANNHDSSEFDERTVDEIHRELNKQIEKGRLDRGERNDASTEQINEQKAANERGNAVQPNCKRTPEISRVRSSVLTADLHTPYELSDGVVCCLPSQAQWSGFEEILQEVRSSEAAQSGVCKFIIPEVGAVKETKNPLPNCHAFKTQVRTNGTIAIDLTPSSTAASSLLTGGAPTLTAQDAVSMFEKRIKQRSGLRGVRYCIDMPAKTEVERSRIGLPSVSPIWPLRGNKLTQTRVRVRGVHSPYAYRAYGSFGAVFGIHTEDCDTFSVNHLYKGSKIWIIVPPSSADLLEQKFRENSTAAKLSDCSQFVREYASYLPLEVLDRWNVPYKIVQQNAGEAMLTFPRAYHQGFSITDSLAEAANYADDDWNTASYSYCDPQTCPAGFIGRELMRLRETNEEQHSAGEENPGEDGEASEQKAMDVGPSYYGKSKPTGRQNRGHGSKAAKRKTTNELSVSYKKNRGDPHGDLRNNAVASKKVCQTNISIVPEGITSKSTIHVNTILQKITVSLDEYNVEYDETRTFTLVRLFYAIASPDAICQLRDACGVIRQGAFQIAGSTDDILGTVKALDRLDASSHIISIAKRFYLVALSTKRFQLQASRTKNSRTGAIQGTGDETFDRDDSAALTELMREAYPHLKPTRLRKTQGKDEYGKKRKTLQERLLNGSKWSRLSDAFTPGILALVPTQGEYHVSNKDFERLSLNAISAFITVLKHYRDDFLRTASNSVSTFMMDFLRGNLSSGKFSFEDTDAILIKREKYDSSNLLELCKITDSHTASIIQQLTDK